MLPRKTTSAALRGVRELGLEVAEDVELGVVGVRDVEVVLVVAAPEEGLAALDALDVARLDAASAQHLELVLAEVVADRPDDADVGEEARGEREMHGGAAQHPLALAERRAHGVEGDRSDDGQGHRGAADSRSVQLPTTRCAS